MPPRSSWFPGILGPACRDWDLAYALIVSRVVAPELHGFASNGSAPVPYRS